MDDLLTREERINKYAYEWYQFRLQNNRSGTREEDYIRAEHIVDGEDKMKMREDAEKYLHMASRMK